MALTFCKRYALSFPTNWDDGKSKVPISFTVGNACGRLNLAIYDGMLLKN